VRRVVEEGPQSPTFSAQGNEIPVARDLSQVLIDVLKAHVSKLRSFSTQPSQEVRRPQVTFVNRCLRKTKFRLHPMGVILKFF